MQSGQRAKSRARSTRLTLEAVEAGIQAARIMAARESFDAFCEYCFDQPLARHHREWYNLIKAPPGVPGGGPHSRVLIEAARGWAKTTIMSRLILWCIGHNPNLFITYVSGDDALAEQVSEEIGDNIVHNRKVRNVFPHLRRDPRLWSKSYKRVMRDVTSKDPTLRACGILSTGAGGRSHFLVFDDVATDRTSVQHPSLREAIKRIFQDVWMKYLLPDGVAVVIATPWHVADVIGALEESASWVKWKTPALDADGHSTWPEFWPDETLRKLREEDPASFERQMMLKALTGYESYFREEVLRACFVPEDHVDRTWPRYVGVDLSTSMTSKGSWNAIVTIAVDPEGRRHIAEIQRFKGQGPDVIEALIRSYRLAPFELAVVENNAYQAALIPFIEKEAPGLPVAGYRTGAQKSDPRIGVPGLHAEMSRGLWVIPFGPEHELPGHRCDPTFDVCELVSELRAFPRGKHSDLVMALWLATRAYAAASGVGAGFWPDAEMDETPAAAVDVHDVSDILGMTWLNYPGDYYVAPTEIV